MTKGELSSDVLYNIEKGQRVLNRKRLAAAIVVAVISDALSFWMTFVPPVQWAIDITTALILFAILGKQWAILPGLIAEAIPGLGVFPFWTLVVVSILVWGKIRKPKTDK